MDIKVLKAEKRALKIKLRRFEDEFIRQNGQKPQSYQEVRMFNMYYTLTHSAPIDVIKCSHGYGLVEL
jgi:hypothetical protein